MAAQTSPTRSRKQIGRLVAAHLAVGVMGGGVLLMATGSSATEPTEPAATPAAACGAGSLPETGRQGRVEPADRANGRSALGYSCNSTLVATSGTTGGFKTLRYVDPAGHECAYYDVPAGADGGVRVLDMAQPANPVEVGRLTTPAMLSPHESLVLNPERGLLVAVMGTALVAPGVVDVYDLTQDCRVPQLRSSTPLGIVGHESGFAPDGRTFYASAGTTGTLVAVGLDDPSHPRLLWTGAGYSGHGVSVSADGRRAYVAELPHSTLLPAGPLRDPLIKPGLTILDVSQVQDRALVPQVTVVSRSTWDSVSLPQNSVPLTIKGLPYLLEFDEFSDLYSDVVGAARIIDLADERNPRVVSTLRLEANQTSHADEQRTDPGADALLGGYAAHYCSVPSRVDPGLVACSFILSGLRVFDIRDPYQPREVAYDSPPQPGDKTVSAVSSPTFVPARHEIWYTDGNSGFRSVRLTNGAWTSKVR